MGPRLLKRETVDDYKFTAKLLDDGVPPYAILSHTWGADGDEVTYEDFNSQQYANKAGYAKIKFCGEQAARDGLDHFWIDSCCIRKSSDSELSESINSMFRWYANSAKCYVYLTDVHSNSDDWKTEFRQSRWFTRGWTLQEMLSPSSVEFFSVEGTRLGDKSSLKQLICEITGLPSDVLDGQPLSSFSVSERLGWSSQRRTTLPEDKAYCLLGLFSVHMPVIYGEGDNAFLRLREEIEKHVRTTTHIHLPPLSQFFTGREKELQLLSEYFSDTQPTKQILAVIAGVGGAGKTALATKYATRHRDSYSAIFSVNASDTMSLRRGFTAIARLLCLPEAVESPAADSQDLYGGSAVVDAVHEWLNNQRQGNWLLIIDNADDLSSISLADYIPRSSKGHVILTSRNSRGASAFSDKPPVELFDMSPHDATEFFIGRAMLADVGDAQRAKCRAIVGQLGHLALAVEHAAAYVHSTTMPLDTFQDLLKQNILDGVSERSPDSLHAHTVQKTVQMAYDKLKVQNPDAAKLLRLIIFFDNDTLSEKSLFSPAGVKLHELLPVLKGGQVYYKAKQTLLSYSIVYCDPQGKPDSLQMHPLVQSILRRGIGTEWQYKWLLRALALAFTMAEESGQLGYAYFPHLRQMFGDAVRLWKTEDRAHSIPHIWHVLAQVTHHYRVHWQVVGLVYELDDFCKTNIEALSNDNDENSRLMKFLVVITRVTTVLFTDSTDTPLKILQSYVESQMTPKAAECLKAIREGAAPPVFTAYTLADVFRHTAPAHFVDAMMGILKDAAVMCSQQNQTLATVFIRISQLPVAETWQTRFRRLTLSPPSLTQPFDNVTDALDVNTRMSLTANDRAAGDMASTVALLEDALQSDSPTMQQVFARYAVILELSNIYYMLGEDQKAADKIALLDPLQTGEAEVDVARKYRDFYIWSRKAQASLLKDHEHHPERLRVLEETSRAAHQVFGKTSLSAMHAALLLSKHHAESCCEVQSERDRYRAEAEQGFIQLYGGEENLRRAEGLNMARILLTQGALEEAESCFEFFLDEAERTLGPEDPVTKRARRWLKFTQRDILLAERDRANGRVTLERGSLFFTRTLQESTPSGD